MSQNLFCQDLRTFCMKISLLPKFCPWRTNDKYKVWFVCFQLFLLQKIYFVCNFSIQLVPLLGCMSLNWLFEKMLREAPLRKTQGLFGHCPNGGGVSTLARMVWGTYFEKNCPCSKGHLLGLGGLNPCQDGLGHLCSEN